MGRRPLAGSRSAARGGPDRADDAAQDEDDPADSDVDDDGEPARNRRRYFFHDEAGEEH